MQDTRQRPSKLKRQILAEQADLLEESLVWDQTVEQEQQSTLKDPPEETENRRLDQATSQRQFSGEAEIDSYRAIRGRIPDMDDRKTPEFNAIEPSATANMTLSRAGQATRLTAPNELLQRLRAGKERREQRKLASIISPVSHVTDKDGNQRRRSQTAAPTPQALNGLRFNNSYAESNGQRTNQGLPLDGITEMVIPPPPYPGFGAQGLAWTYYTATAVDEQLMDGGIWLWNAPQTYRKASPWEVDELSFRRDLTDQEEQSSSDESAEWPVLGSERQKHAGIQKSIEPVLVQTSDLRFRISPIITKYPGSLLTIEPHFPPWPDVRADPLHPDYLPPSKLASYQSCEIAGYKVWRHDRDFFPCSRKGCYSPAPDFSPLTRVCIGCGPKSSIRYCSHEHELEAFAYHWSVCGKPESVAKDIMDHSTGPLYFSNMCPAIQGIRGRNSFNLHRQKHFACHSLGLYTLFMSQQGQGQTLGWPQDDSKSREMDFRIERLLNIAFFDPDEKNLVQYLYRLLRHLISISPLNSKEHLQALKTQFAAEFGKVIYKHTDAEPIFPCDCVWYGSNVGQSTHLETCSAKVLPQAEQTLGLLEKVKQLERKYWILRAWAQQHPRVTDWELRAQGSGYGVQEDNLRLGPGFVGWGAQPSNMFG